MTDNNWESKFDEFELGQEIVIDGRTATIENHPTRGKWFTRIPGKNNSWVYLIWVKHYSSRRGYSWIDIDHDITN